MIQPQDIVTIGHLARTHGKQGQLQLNADNELLEEAERAEFVLLRLDGILTPFRLDDWRTKGAEAYILTLHDIDSEEQAQRLVGAEVALLRRDITDTPDEEALTLQDLIGFQVFELEQGYLGTIEDVDESTLNALFLLSGDIVIPAHDDFVSDIDYPNRKLILSLPEGLI